MEFWETTNTRHNGLLIAPTCYGLVVYVADLLQTCCGPTSYGEVANLLRICYGKTGVWILAFSSQRLQPTGSVYMPTVLVTRPTVTVSQNSPFSSIAVAVTVASTCRPTHFAYPQRDNLAELAWVSWLNTMMVHPRLPISVLTRLGGE